MSPADLASARLQFLAWLASRLASESFKSVSIGPGLAAPPGYLHVKITFAGNLMQTAILSTDQHGEGLLLVSTDAGIAPFTRDVPLLPAHEFSLNRFDLSTPRGVAAARGYVRRKLRKMAKQAVASTFPFEK